MLSKQQAKLFFIGGTILFAVIFLGMTYNTLTKGIPEHTDVKGLTDQVKHGKRLWDSNNCMGCHTIMGEGAYYAPELTRVIDRRGKEMVKAILTSKVPWAPNGRKMVAYGFSDEDADAIISFFEWVGRADLNGFPPKPTIK